MQDLSNEELNKIKKTNDKLAKKQLKKQAYEEKQQILNPYKIDLINIWKKYPKKVLWMFVSAFLYNIAITVFLKKAATIASGTSSLSQIITFTAPQTADFYGLFYVLVNLPLMFIFWRHNPRMFMVLTYYWMLFQIIVQCIFIDYNKANPIIKFINEKLSIYNPTGRPGDYWDPFGTNITTGALQKLVDSGKFSTISEALNDALKNKGAFYDGQNWPIIFYAALGGIAEGFASVIAWKQRGSIGGTSVISNYIAYKNKKPVGNMFLIVALCFSTFSTIVIGTLEITNKVPEHKWHKGTSGQEFLVRICGTLIYLVVFTLLVNRYYPKYKKVKIEIYTTKVEWIAEHFKKIGYIHSYNIFYGVSGYKHYDFAKIETIALYLERDWIFEEVKKIDPSAWISTSNIHDISGQFDTSKVD
ncbi:YitT family protein [Metamycoplasma buccale]|uniref:YitT family protein n=1 Tax=Metamycoplasma buccale TaxID=55602 RepID=UPI00398EF909